MSDEPVHNGALASAQRLDSRLISVSTFSTFTAAISRARSGIGRGTLPASYSARSHPPYWKSPVGVAS
jgi:hypothetical protein